MIRILAVLAILALPSTVFGDVVRLNITTSFQWGFRFSPEGLAVDLSMLVSNRQGSFAHGRVFITADEATKFEKIYENGVHTQSFYKFEDALVDLNFSVDEFGPIFGHYIARIPALSFTVLNEDKATLPGLSYYPDIWHINWRFFHGRFDQSVADYFGIATDPSHGAFSVVVAEEINVMGGTPDQWRNAYMNGTDFDITVPEPGILFLYFVAAVPLLRKARR